MVHSRTYLNWTHETHDEILMRESHMFDRIDLLSDSECGEIRSAVYELRHLWISRDRHYPFFTLATASYLDAAAPGSAAAYCRMAAAHNSILQERFGWLYDRLQQALGQHLGAPALQCEDFAIPGFHIFLAHELFQKSLASIHCDLQYQLLDWGDPASVDFTRPLSFTLSISLPKSGAGLNLWEIDQSEMATRTSWQKQSLIETRKKTFVPYKAGSMILHSGHRVHQIAPMTHAEPGEERITLQGHAILRGGAWQLYW
jgi:hypothetical protein